MYEFMSDIKKIDLGAGGELYVYIYGFGHVGDCLVCALGVCYRFLGIWGCLLDCLEGDVLKLEFKS